MCQRKCFKTNRNESMQQCAKTQLTLLFLWNSEFVFKWFFLVLLLFPILKLIKWQLFQHLSSTTEFLTVCFDLIQMMPFFTTFLHLSTKVFDDSTKILHWFCDILLQETKVLERIAICLQWFSIIWWK